MKNNKSSNQNIETLWLDVKLNVKLDLRGAAALLSKLQNKLKQIYDLSARNCLITWFDLTEEEIICHTKRPVISPLLDLK